MVLALTSGLLAGCCGSVECDCGDEQADAVIFRFNPDSLATQSPRGYRSADVDTVLLVRYPLDTAQRPRLDSALFARPRRLALDSTSVIALNNARPFTQTGRRKLNAYRYEIYLGRSRYEIYQGRSRRRQPAYTITNVQLEGRLEADGCCTCYRNTRKALTLNGQEITLTDQSSQNRPGRILLSR